MRRTAYATLVPTVLSLVLAFTPASSADHLFASTMDPPISASAENRLNLLANCALAFTPGGEFILVGTGETSYAAGTGFFVHHGWVSFTGDWPFSVALPDWDQVPPEGKRAFMSRATTFELWIDDELQRSTLHAPVAYSPTFDTVLKHKIFVVEDHDGLQGQHSFVGRWYLDASFFGGELGERVSALECDITVDFT